MLCRLTNSVLFIDLLFLAGRRTFWVINVKFSSLHFLKNGLQFKVKSGVVRHSGNEIFTITFKGGTMNGDTEKLSSEKIEEALQLLSEAAQEKKNELRTLLSDRYADLKTAFTDKRATISEALSETSQRAAHRMRNAKEAGQEKIVDFAEEMDIRVHEKPWTYVGGVALAGLILGYLFGRRQS